MKNLALVVVGLIAVAAGAWFASPGVTLRGLGNSAPATVIAGSIGPAPFRQTQQVKSIGAKTADVDAVFAELISVAMDSGQLKVRAQLAEIAKTIDPSKFEKLLNRAGKLGWNVKRNLIPALIEQWLAVDPGAAGRWMKNPRNTSLGWEAWVAKDTKGAIQFAAEQTSPGLYGRLLSSAIRAEVGDSLEAQVKYLNQMPGSNVRDSALVVALSDWSRENPTQAAAFFESMPPGKSRDSLLPIITAALARTAVDKAVELLDRQPESATKRQLLEKTLPGYVSLNADDAIRRADELMASALIGVLGNSFVNRFSDALAKKDIESAKKWVESLPPEMGQDPLIAFSRTWAQKEPAAALEWAIAHGVDITRGFYENGPSTTWSGAVLNQAMLSNPQETVDWILAMPAGAERNRLVERALHERFFNMKPDQLFQGPNEVLLKLFAELPPDAQPRSAWHLGVKRAQRADFNDMQQWASSFPAGESQQLAIGGAMRTVASQDPSRAEKMLEEIQDPQQRDAALSGIVLSLGTKNIEAAANRALEIKDSDMQFSTLNRFIADWLHDKPDDAREWLKNAKIPSQWKTNWQTESAVGYLRSNMWTPSEKF